MMAIDDGKLYEEIGQRWQQYTSWREKIFAGYLSVVAALAFAFSKEQGTAPVCAVILAFAALVSVVFWILDFRTTELVNLCQATGDDLAGRRGFYNELNARRFADKNKSLVYYGMAINILVAGVIAASSVGCFVYLCRWQWQCTRNGWWVPGVTVAAAVVVEEILRRYAHKKWLAEQKRYKERISETIPSRSCDGAE